MPIENVWQALTVKDKMRKWYFPQLQKFEPEVGFKFQFEDDGAGYLKEWVMTKVVKGRMLAHSWAYKGYPGSSEVTFDLFSEEGKTRLRGDSNRFGKFS
ncbi:SRPBCC family protein [Maribellus maritimus]|uniref:SRPBCC family protein n=1 Tax=Maribellus maritimus TaxID=2870838 RepID=UPI00293E037F|nr:SRPBCC family protein [Maribellus maritimus]MCG6188497.1 SRPBCC domain-containing protein [Maribellus maritimus]